MSEEKNEDVGEAKEHPPLWDELVNPYISLNYIDDTGVWTWDDLPDTLMESFGILPMICCALFHTLCDENAIGSLADCDLLAQHILPKYANQFYKVLNHIACQATEEYRQVKKRPCTICQKEVSSDRHLNICAQCKERYAGEAQLVKIHLYRARRAGTEATLTVAEWIATLNRFNWKCAYCQERGYELLEHYVPITKGGGTTQENCVPGCRKCNAQKRDTHPEAVQE